MSRGNYKFNRSNYHDYARAERVDWLDQFAEKYAKDDNPKTAVEVARQRGNKSIMEQIDAIVNNKHSSVESAVKELQDRVGLTEYLKRMSSDDKEAIKEAAEVGEAGGFPEGLAALIPQEVMEKVRDNIKFLLKKHNGHISVPAIQFELSVSFDKDLDDRIINDSQMCKFINDQIIDWRSTHPSNADDRDRLDDTAENEQIVDEDNKNKDFFSGLMPIT
jgi:hypothetical protein